MRPVKKSTRWNWNSKYVETSESSESFTGPGGVLMQYTIHSIFGPQKEKSTRTKL